jgi:signal transduction histidine kinase
MLQVAGNSNELAFSIVHDLRNPLSAICGCAELLVTANLDPEQTRRIAGNIRRAGEQMKNLLTSIVSVAKGRAEDIQSCKLSEILSAACDAAGVARRDDINMVVHASQEIELWMDRRRMERVFLNLITNAMEAIPSAGTICITASESDNRIQVTVEDTGPGIPAEIRGRLFEPFATAGKKDGLGLGLAFSRQAVRDHGGDLWAEPSRGARFVMRLPKRLTADYRN